MIDVPIITSILDQDLYKLCMGNAILYAKNSIPFDSINVEYEFINRGKTQFPIGFDKALKNQVQLMSKLTLKPDEKEFIKNKCYYIRRSYFDFLDGFRFDPNQVKIHQDGGDLSIKISGPWYSSIYWEVPLLATISELYYIATKQTEKTIWSDYKNRAYKKGCTLKQNDVVFSDFGTRRRFSKEVHDQVVSQLINSIGKNGKLSGTSNLLLAMKYNLTPIGTMAHEIFMAMAAIFGFKQANRLTLEMWAHEYDGNLGFALSDTFTSDVFFKQFSLNLAMLFSGVRQDSGDPFEFAEKIIKHYEALRIDPKSKTIVFSDKLNCDKAIAINNAFKSKINCAFGIGTYFTNDLENIEPLNIVIKMTKCNGTPTIKLSDDSGKNSGDSKMIELAKYQLNIK